MATASSSVPSSEKTVSDPAAVVELILGHTFVWDIEDLLRSRARDVAFGVYSGRCRACSGSRRGPEAGRGVGCL
jgi:hypothetical protein